MRIAGLLLFLVLALPPVAELLERRVLTQAALQIPLLALAGFLIGRSLPARVSSLSGWNEDGLPCLLIGSTVAMLWMLPRAMDASLADLHVELAKYVTLPLVAGLPLGLAWPRLGWLARAFVWANAVSMLATLGWLYRAAPARLCNYYLLDDQRQLGAALIALCVGLGLSGLVRAFATRKLRTAVSGAASSLGAGDSSLGTARCHNRASATLLRPRAGTRIERANESVASRTL